MTSRLPRHHIVRLIPFVLLALLPIVGCGVKKQKIRVTDSYAKAKTLSRSELMTLFEKYFHQYDTILIRKASLTFIGESQRLRKREKLPTASGVLILDRKGDLRLQIYTPVIKTTAVDVLATGGQFEIWYPRKKTLYKGSVEEDLQHLTLPAADDDTNEPRYNLSRLRPWHITNTFFQSRLDPHSLFAIIEEDAPLERYYVLHELRISDSKPPVILQKLWLERSTLQIRKKILYNEDGAPLSRIYYRDYVHVGEGEFPQTIILERPLEGYQVNFKIENVQTDIKLNPEMFTLKIPEDAKVVNLKSSEKK